MLKKIPPLIFGSRAANIFMIIGVVLLCLTLYFGINPAEGSVVDPLVRGTWAHKFLFFASLTAMMVMLFVGDGIIGIALMFLLQIGVYWGLGKIGVLLFSPVAKPKRKNRR
jgi:hypothetical protein